MLKEFKEFALKGSVLDLAIGIIVGAAFGRVVSSLVNDILMPPLGLLVGKVNFGSLFLNLSTEPYTNLAAAKAAGAPTINYGIFLNTLLDFLMVAAVVFLLVKQVNKLRKQTPVAPPPTNQEILLGEIRDLLSTRIKT